MGTNTGLGIGIGIPFKNFKSGGRQPLPPDLKASLKGVWIAYGKSNNDSDRAVVKNLVDASNPFIISNAAYKLNSGYGLYATDFTTWTKVEGVETTSNGFRMVGEVSSAYWILFLYNTIVPSCKIRVSGIPEGGNLKYANSVILKNGINEIPEMVVSAGANGFTRNLGTTQVSDWIGLSVEQIPSFQGALVTDGVDDLITSTKTVQEMLGGSNEITVVSMIHKMSSDMNWSNLIGELKGNHTFVANRGINTDKTGIYGYTYNYNENAIVINNILGDKNDYIVRTSTSLGLDNKYYVTGFTSAGVIQNISQIAWYWTFIANRVLTTDEINQVIAYYNLDRTLKPDILCNTIKQGITNENHAEFGDKLIDFSGNGRDIQLNNIAWKGDSGIGKYNFSNINIIANRFEGAVTTNKCHFTKKLINTTSNFCDLIVISPNEPIKFKVSGLSDGRKLFVANKSGSGSNYNFDNGEHEVSLSFSEGVGQNNPFGVTGDIGDIDVTVEFIPSHAGALCFNGVDDFGKVTGMPVYKDYTIIADYERFYLEPITGGRASILSKSSKVGDGSFIFNLEDRDGGKACYTFGGANGNISDDITRIIRYQSKYYNTKTLSIGTAEDNDFMVLGKVREVDSRHFCGAIYSLMSFPYSMSEFLIERQLKKHKLGTLYPDMVEFRPVIKSNVLLDAKPTFVIRGTSTYLNVGDYVPENSQIWVSIKMNNIADRITKFTVNGKTIDIPENAYSEVTLQYGFPFVIDKSPQKITMTIEQDENYVKFEPVITSNVEYVRLDFYLNNYQKRINIGDYIPKDAYIRANFYLKNNVDELTVFTFNGVNIDYRRSSVDDTAFNIGSIYNYNFPQEVNITIDEYIRFEDIVQPYPALLRFNDENGNEVSWGGKFKVGSTITRIGSAADSNLLPNIYNIFGLLLNGNQVTSSKVIVEKTMVFKAKSAYIFDNNEPKCILSPRLLRIPNSSYKILGHIPDISGHGNNGKINNSAYKLNSGVNGYLVDFTTLKDDGIKGIVRTDSKIYLDKSFNYNQGFWLGRTNNPSPAYKVKVSGIPETGMLTYTGGVWLNLVNGINELPARTNTEEEHGFVIQSPNLDWSNLVIEQIGEYEGAYCLDGVDDFVTIPTIVGGKQVLMKMNWQNRTGLLYDQRKNGSSIDAFAILNVNSNNSIAYNSRNTDGETYIDGILNKNIVCPQLYKITHSITIINQLANKEEVMSPTIGSDTTHKIYFSQMSLYDFMLFDNISTDDKIKELNEYVGIEAKVELPPYYWDTYGKTNFDADRDTIQQRGIAVGDYDLTNTNFAYDKMSGFGGYEFEKFTDTTKWIETKREDGIEVIEKNDYSFTAKKVGTGQYFWDFKNNRIKTLDRDLTVKAISNNNVYIRWEFKYRTAEKPDIDSAIILLRQAMTPNVPITVTLPYKTQEEQTELGVVEGSTYYLFYFDPSDIPVGDEYTVEMLPLYPNGLLYDAVTDYSENVNIPVFTDFTAIMKRKWLKNQGCPLIKGSKVYEGGNGNALLFEWDKAYNFVFYKRTDIMEGEVPDNISFITPTNYNGNVITRGSEQDTNGICIAGDGNAGFANMVFYKLILYPKTIPLLQINFLKNLMEKDEIIDLTNPIFIKDE